MMYWICVAIIPAVIWIGWNEHSSMTTAYLSKGQFVIAYDLDLFYWRPFFWYASVLLLPVCAWKIIVLVKSLFATLSDKPMQRDKAQQ
jgi:hypothetical protein